jgi:hypothetical protein
MIHAETRKIFTTKSTKEDNALRARLFFVLFVVR